MDARYRTFWPRFGAVIIDSIILWPIGVAFEFVYNTGLPIVVFAAFVLDSIIAIAYSVYFHARYGQTIGKWLMKVKVLSVNETRLSFRQAVLRDAIAILLSTLYALYAIVPIFSGKIPNTPEFENSIPTLLMHLTLLVVALEVGTMLTNAKRRSLHDFIAGSVVIRLSNRVLESDARREQPRAPQHERYACLNDCPIIGDWRFP